ncbi:MAG: hypothetical protein AAB834_04975 [Patescibacteria group bacterium]
MGSTGKRKSADKLRINRPMDGENSAEGAGGAGGTPSPQDINNICPLTLRTKLTRQDISVGAELILDDNVLQLAADRSVEVGTATAAVIKTLQTCMGLGINYLTTQVVEDKQGVRYAEFAQ